MRHRFGILPFVAGGSLVLLCAGAQRLLAQPPPAGSREFLPPPFDRYMQRRVAELSQADWQAGVTRENWPKVQSTMRRQLQGMLGLDPWPERAELKPVITGTVPGDGYVVEKLHFQSLPGLYVTANLYRPAKVEQSLPAILYVCGHSNVVENGVSMGNKTGYQHHGIWFARNGYVCIVLDTIQLGEIRGEHHGTYKFGRWWWAARGYTPAGVEAWNGIRALDYLETRPEVDRTRLAITGRSGGGAYSWWVAALDERIKVAVPVAGITTLENHVLDGAIEGHCDCMFMVNTERWDFDRVAALMAPRPLLISNTDKDGIFPLDGVMEIYNRTRALYRKLGKEENIGVHIAEGPHKDTQPLNTGAFHWLNRFLKGADPMSLTDEPARKAHPPRDLRVFAGLPADEKVTTADQFFVPAFSPLAHAGSSAEWTQRRDAWMQALRSDCFRAWPANPPNAALRTTKESTAEGLRLTVAEFRSEDPFDLPLWILHRDGLEPEEIEGIVLNVLDEEGWSAWRSSAAAGFSAEFSGASPDAGSFAELRTMLLNSKRAMAYVCPRGVGPTGWVRLSEKKQTHLRRRLLLLGESLESGQTWDIQQAAAALRSLPGWNRAPLSFAARGLMAGNALYASLFIPEVKRLDLHAPPASHRTGPTYLNVLRHLDLPQAVALAAERSPVALYVEDPEPWRFAQSVANALRLGPEQLQIRQPVDPVRPASR
ncbi:MAG: acetylxylan esterase [Verrucomicrobiota bacterium]|nr:acetylxylan esterase [Verrucomicrobiota bacterium]